VPTASLAAELRRAAEDEANIARVWGKISAADRSVLGIYARHGGTLDGRVAFLELRTRGVIRLVKDRWSEHIDRNPLQSLRDRQLLLREAGYAGYEPFSHGMERAFPTLGMVEPLLPHTTPAGPPPGPSARPVETRSRCSAVRPRWWRLASPERYATLSSGLKIRLNRSGEISIPRKAHPGEGTGTARRPEFPLADAGGFWFELLRAAGMITVEDGQVKGDEAAADELFSSQRPSRRGRWATAWLSIQHWSDSAGVRVLDLTPQTETRTSDVRAGLGAGCLARADGEPWFELETFLSELHEVLGPRGVPPGTTAVCLHLNPPHAARKAKMATSECALVRRNGRWYANA
jgi:hypothetical protein